MPNISSHALWFEHLLPAQKRDFQLFCFPYAGGNAQIFRHWQRRFSPDVDICLVHLPGRERRIGEPPFTRLTSLVEALADAMEPQLHRPLAFYGHSMGSLISFELAHELHRRYGIAPVAIFLSGHGAPPTSRTEPPSFTLSDEEFMARLEKYNGTPRELLHDPEAREFFLPLLRADFAVVDSYEYVPGPPLPCPITAYGGLQDPGVSVEHLQAWHKHTSATCKTRMFAGDHFFLQTCATDFVTILRRDVLASMNSAGDHNDLFKSASEVGIARLKSFQTAVDQ